MSSRRGRVSSSAESQGVPARSLQGSGEAVARVARRRRVFRASSAAGRSPLCALSGSCFVWSARSAAGGSAQASFSPQPPSVAGRRVTSCVPAASVCAAGGAGPFGARASAAAAPSSAGLIVTSEASCRGAAGPAAPRGGGRKARPAESGGGPGGSALATTGPGAAATATAPSAAETTSAPPPSSGGTRASSSRALGRSLGERAMHAVTRARRSAEKLGSMKTSCSAASPSSLSTWRTIAATCSHCAQGGLPCMSS
mmetsp:Transcript_12094/g.32810  ORF Transcript_12094/g.32810 Transcript_12094/m.32810 type:complete len:256 (-) Transcript_12094:547-1314(-)